MVAAAADGDMTAVRRGAACEVTTTAGSRVPDLGSAGRGRSGDQVFRG